MGVERYVNEQAAAMPISIVPGHNRRASPRRAKPKSFRKNRGGATPRLPMNCDLNSARGQTVLLPEYVEPDQGRWLFCQKFHQLRHRAAELLGTDGQVSVAFRDHVERLGDQHREIGVFVSSRKILPSTHRDRHRSLGAAAPSSVAADFQCQIHLEPFDGVAMIVDLAASFGGLAFDARRLMLDHDGRLGLVPMLPARPAPPRMTDRAVLSKSSSGKHGMMRSA